jgi:hypothetical protein
MDQNNSFSKKEVLETLFSMPDRRLPFPIALTDPAFSKCLMEAAAIPEFVENFDRLTGCQVGRIGTGPAIVDMIDQATGFRDEQLRQFAEFVHDSVYMRLPNEALHAIRLSATAAPNA